MLEYWNKQILGCLLGCAVGDAMGAVSENLSYDQIRCYFPGGIKDFLTPPETACAYGSALGEVTDDFSQTYLLTKEILAQQGEISEQCVRRMLLTWADQPRFYDRFSGPTTRHAIEVIRSLEHGIVYQEPRRLISYASQATNGSAMKISPAGFFHPCDVEHAIDDAITITMVTHDNQLSISGACAVAAAIATAFENHASIYDLISAALYGAKKGEAWGLKHAHIASGPSVVKRLQLAISIALNHIDQKEVGLHTLYDVIGSGLHISEAVPCAFGIMLLHDGHTMDAIHAAVNIGYDTDTIAAITGSMVGAMNGVDSFPNDYLSLIQKQNDMDLISMSTQVIRILQKMQA